MSSTTTFRILCIEKKKLNEILPNFIKQPVFIESVERNASEYQVYYNVSRGVSQAFVQATPQIVIKAQFLTNLSEAEQRASLPPQYGEVKETFTRLESKTQTNIQSIETCIGDKRCR